MIGHIRGRLLAKSAGEALVEAGADEHMDAED